MRVLSTNRLLLGGCMLLAALASAPLPAVAQTAATGTSAASIPAPVIAIVDVDQILQEAVAAKAVRSQADKYQQTFQAEITKEESALRATQQEVDQQRKTLSQEAFAEKARAFDTSVAEFQRKGMARRRAFDKSFNTAMGQVQQAMLEATQEVSGRHGATVVLPRSQVMLFDDKMNITKDIIAVMDKKLSHVDFPPPKVELDNGPATSGGARKTQ